MQNLSKYLSFVVLGLTSIASASSSTTQIAKWDFTTIVSGPYNTPAPTVELTSAYAIELGMTNSYLLSNGDTFSVADCDVDNTGGDPNPNSIGYTWRVRGNGSGGGNGWSISAPQYTQGVEFDCSTIGYTDVSFSFDWYSTNQGIYDLQLQYNLNVSNSSGWTNYKGNYNGNQPVTKDAFGDTLLLAAPSLYNVIGYNVVTNVVDFSGVIGASNNPNFGVRLVSAYDPSSGEYLGASGGEYNNNSGNWRFDQIVFSGIKPTVGGKGVKKG